VKIPRMQWIVAALLFLATMINYADRLALGVVSVRVRAEFSLDETDYSHIVTMFMLAYAVMYAVSGYAVDRMGTRRGFAVFIAGWSVAQMLHGFSVGKWSLAACRFALGLFEPANWPAAAKAVAEWFPPERRALGIGIFNAGSSMGSALAPPVVAWLTLAFGWRAAFIFTGALGLVWLVFWLNLYQPPHLNRFLRAEEYAAIKDRVRPPAETVPAARGTVSWRRVLSLRGCYTLVIARFFTDPVIYFVIFWLPEYLQKERGFDLAMVGKYAWVPFIFGDIGYITGGWLSGKFVLILGACCLPVAILAPMVPSAALAIAATCFLTFGHALWISNLLTLPTDLFPASEVGTASGLTGMGGAIGGVLANLGTGYLVSRFSYAPVFWIAGLMHPLSCVIVHRLLPDREFQRTA
jgi:ACS family hexuronate transporter-like MFS transporter